MKENLVNIVLNPNSYYQYTVVLSSIIYTRWASVSFLKRDLCESFSVGRSGWHLQTWPVCVAPLSLWPGKKDQRFFVKTRLRLWERSQKRPWDSKALTTGLVFGLSSRVSYRLGIRPRRSCQAKDSDLEGKKNTQVTKRHWPKASFSCTCRFIFPHLLISRPAYLLPKAD